MMFLPKTYCTPKARLRKSAGQPLQINVGKADVGTQQAKMTAIKCEILVAEAQSTFVLKSPCIAELTPCACFQIVDSRISSRSNRKLQTQLVGVEKAPKTLMQTQGKGLRAKFRP
eukprot:3940810-Rhodomonas_salina.2